MTTQQKVIKVKVGLLELGKQLGTHIRRYLQLPVPLQRRHELRQGCCQPLARRMVHEARRRLERRHDPRPAHPWSSPPHHLRRITHHHRPRPQSHPLPVMPQHPPRGRPVVSVTAANSSSSALRPPLVLARYGAANVFTITRRSLIDRSIRASPMGSTPPPSRPVE